ncbi:CAP domain-containing protein [Streptomyces sp. NPDC046712]|uniref:CAP domain-containing protein n=1 Tax=Streptomyces sp. NPDC046712 TaxID=3154802 RepID=UPI0033ED34BC
MLNAAREGVGFGLTAATTAAFPAQQYGSDTVYGASTPYGTTGSYETAGTYGTPGPYETTRTYETAGTYETTGAYDTTGAYETTSAYGMPTPYDGSMPYATLTPHESAAPYGMPSPAPYESPAPYGTGEPYGDGAAYAPSGPYGTSRQGEQAGPMGGFESAADGPMAAHEQGGPYEPRTPYETQSTVSPLEAGARSSRGARRRREQERRRGRRRAVVAAGMAVVAVTGGSFYLSTGPDGEGDALDANRAAAPGPDLPLGQTPTTLLETPSPSASTSASAGATPSTRPSPTAKATPSKTAAPRTSSPAPKPKPKTTSSSNPDSGSGAGAQGGSGSDSTADQVISLVNAERAKAGCGPLTANSQLTRAAQAHSDDMAARDFFDHTNPDGAGPGERVTATGYPWSTYGENIAMGQSSAEQVMESWMNSPGHRANILNCSFKEIGVGIHNQGGPYWTQVFGAR